MATKHNPDPNNPTSKEGKRMALELKHEHMLAEAKVGVLTHMTSFISYLNVALSLIQKMLNRPRVTGFWINV